MEATIFNIQRYSIDDGPGIRTTVFFKGCPLTCKWCSNPESQKPEPQLSYRYTTCVHCGTCVKVCPKHIIKLDEDGVHIDRSRCVSCFTCVDNCEAEALKVSGERMTVEQVFKKVKKDEVYYQTSGGGVTASGGEILLQADFVRELFKKCREAGYHTCADTTGFGSADAMRKVLEYSSLVFYDMKHIDEAEHRRACGVGLEQIMKNLRLAAESPADLTIRIPLIPGFNDSAEVLGAMADIIKTLPGKANVNILPYHKYGANKYRMLDREYALESLEPPTDEKKAEAREIFLARGLECEVTK